MRRPTPLSAALPAPLGRETAVESIAAMFSLVMKIEAADHIISAKNQEYYNWIYDKNYGMNQACCSLPFFSAACHCDQTLAAQTGGADAITSATADCGGVGQAACA